MYPINDPQAVQNPRPDSAEYPQSRSYTEVIYNGAGLSLAVGEYTEIVTSVYGYFSGGYTGGGFYSGGYFYNPVSSVDGALLTETEDFILLETGDRLMKG